MGTNPRHPNSAPPSAGDHDLVLVAALLWIASLYRVMAALIHGEVFGAEATLALASLAGLPFVALSFLRAKGARAGPGDSAADPRDLADGTSSGL